MRRICKEYVHPHEVPRQRAEFVLAELGAVLACVGHGLAVGLRPPARRTFPWQLQTTCPPLGEPRAWPTGIYA